LARQLYAQSERENGPQSLETAQAIDLLIAAIAPWQSARWRSKNSGAMPANSRSDSAPTIWAPSSR
jgi:hypothetical protein